MQVMFSALAAFRVADDTAMAQKTIDRTAKTLKKIRQELAECVPQTNYSAVLRTKVLIIQSETVCELSTHLAIMRVNALYQQLVEVSDAFMLSMQGLEYQLAGQIGAIRLQILALSKYSTEILNQNKTLLEKQLVALQ